MFQIAEKDYLPLTDYIFGWRWMDAKRIVIPKEDLNLIKPMAYEKAKMAYAYSNGLQGKTYFEKYDEKAFYEIDSRYDTDKAAINSWLAAQLPKGNEKLFVSWSEQQAVETDQNIFIKYWDTFCYPVEDSVIWPENEKWILLFDYKQRFYFAVSKA